MPEVEAELARRLAAGEEAVLATVIRLDGEPPSRSGAKALFDRERQLAGTLGCSEFDSQARSAAPELLERGQPGLRTFSHDLGSIEVYLEPYASRPVLVVMADTPVASALRRWAPELGFEVRTEVPGEPVPAGVYAVCTDHDAPDLVAALQRLLALGPRFVGLMGSRRHTGHHLEALRAQGMPEAEVSRIQSPVGLDIGAQSPAEIALSILAGLVAVRRGAPAGWKDAPPPP
ncbi:MAG: XdhC family protein [Candidatus Dormibacteraeota bacterium]|nr:XdhC family protein [Candidatus Dormibacteraeota bacterium]